MSRKTNKIRTICMAGAALMLSLALGVNPTAGLTADAQEAFGYYDENGNWVEEAAELPIEITEPGEEAVEENAGVEAPAAQQTGTYTMADGWSSDGNASTAERSVYKADAFAGADPTSTITCSYLDTNYSVLEYEQLRDMLTNNLLYSNVNAQISTSAVYTDARDYLYILISDDSTQDFRTVYCYVVGDYRCFCVEVKEYRAEAEQLKAQEQKTPQEAGQEAAESFVWNS